MFAKLVEITFGLATSPATMAREVVTTIELAAAGLNSYRGVITAVRY